MNMQFLMKQAQKIQGDIAKAQKALAEKEYQGTAGGGAVSIAMMGDFKVSKVTIDPEMMKEDVADVEVMIASAFQDVVGKVEADREAVMQPITGGAKMPGMF